MRKGFAIPLILVIIFVSLFAVGIGYFLFKSKLAPQPQTTTISQPISTPTPVLESTTKPVETANLKTYKNEKIGFQFDYPSKYSKAVYEDDTKSIVANFNGVDEVRDVVFGSPLQLSFKSETDYVSLSLNVGKGKLGEKATLADLANASLGFLDKATIAKVKTEKILIDGVEGLQTKIEGSTLSTFFIYKDYIIVISIVPSSANPALEKPVFNEIDYQKIISSFKFIK